MRNPCYLARLQGLEPSEARGDEWQQVAEAIRLCSEDHDCDAPPAHRLLEFESSVDGQDYIEFRRFGRRKKRAIFQPC